MDIIIQDLRYGMRQLLKNPGFCVVAVLTLALGVAVNSTMFSLVSAFLFQRPPGRQPKRVAVVTTIDPAQGFQADASPVSVPNYLAWREANHVFSEVAAADVYRTANLSSQRQSEVLRSAAVSPDYFDVLGVTAQLGRNFQAGEDQVGQDHVVILSHDIWERRFGSDPAVIGRTIRLNREPYTVIGVMPASFRLMGFTTQLWTPLTLSAADQTTAARADRSLYLFARLKPGVRIEEARAELITLARRAEANFPQTEKGWSATVRTLPDFLVYTFGFSSALAVLMTTVGFVLAIACANVAGLLLARAAGRRKELSIRRALGADRRRLIQQLLTESFLIAVFGGGFGLLGSYWGINLLRASMTFNEAISAIPLTLDRNVLLFATAISLVCAVVCGLAPSLNATRTDVTDGLKDESRTASPGRSRTRLRTVLVTAEIALALFLLVGTGLLVHGLFVIDHQDLGFQPDHVLTAGVTLDRARYQDTGKRALFVRDLISRVQQLPGAEAVAVSSDLPATFPNSVSLHIKDRPDEALNRGLSAIDFVVSADYFRAMGIRPVQGRTFSEADDTAAPRVALVNEKFVERYLKGQDPLGKQIRLEVAGTAPVWREVVGVVGNVKSYSESTRDEPEVYEPFLQRPTPSFSVLIRTASDPNILVSALYSTVAQMDGELPLSRVMSMPAVIESQRAGNPLFLRLLGGFALLALILAAIGIYGLIAYSVSQRTHEIGIRIALGARSQDVLGMVLGQGVKMTAVGALVGLAMALPLPKVFGAIFFDLRVGEPRVYFIVPIAIFVVATLATYVPARRAAQTDPMSALRHD